MATATHFSILLGNDAHSYFVCPLLAQSVNLRSVGPRPGLGVKPTCRLPAWTSQSDPFQKSLNKSV